MYQHNIFIGNDYKSGERIALDYVIEPTNKEIQEKLIEFSNRLYCGLEYDAGITTHAIVTSDKSWQSVVSKDRYFDDIRLVTDVNEFIRIMKNNAILNEADVKMLVFYLLKKNTVLHVDREKIFKEVVKEYKEKYNEPIFERNKRKQVCT